MPWKSELKNRTTTLDDLNQICQINKQEQETIREILMRAPMSIPPYYLSLIDFNDKHDPIRKIAVPSILEADLSGSLDTSGEASNTVVKGLQHKYRETALLLSTDECAMYCRHCFRKRLVGVSDSEIVHDLNAVRAYLLDHPEINNVLVSGGDALMNSNARLDAILDILTDLPSLDFVRIATRIPVSLPARITEDQELLDILSKHNGRKQLYLVTQFDHPREVTEEAAACAKAVLTRGIPVRNQTVLLRGVNSNPTDLAELFHKLTAIGVEPYYVFQCRPVSGVKGHFQIPLKEGVRIVEQAKAQQNGIGKALRYCMSHPTGKIEILGENTDNTMLFKYHEAKDRANLGRIFTQEVKQDQAWLDSQ